MGIPQSWHDERSLLYATMQEQSERAEARRQVEKLRETATAAGISLVAAIAPDDTGDEVQIDDTAIAGLDETPVTDEELALLVDARGQYRAGDTRGFVIAQERLCHLQNCWMQREPDGSTRYVSEYVVTK